MVSLDPLSTPWLKYLTSDEFISEEIVLPK
jgi:hypothetical protein